MANLFLDLEVRVSPHIHRTGVGLAVPGALVISMAGQPPELR
jgi:hypothetical protein